MSSIMKNFTVANVFLAILGILLAPGVLAFYLMGSSPRTGKSLESVLGFIVEKTGTGDGGLGSAFFSGVVFALFVTVVVYGLLGWFIGSIFWVLIAVLIVFILISFCIFLIQDWMCRRNHWRKNDYYSNQFNN